MGVKNEEEIARGDRKHAVAKAIKAAQSIAVQDAKPCEIYICLGYDCPSGFAQSGCPHCEKLVCYPDGKIEREREN